MEITFQEAKIAIGEKYLTFLGKGICAFCKCGDGDVFSLPLLTPFLLCENCIKREPISDPKFFPGFFPYLESLTPYCSAIGGNVEEENGVMCRLCYVVKGAVPVSNLDIALPMTIVDSHDERMVQLEHEDFLCNNCFWYRGFNEREEIRGVPNQEVEPTAAVSVPKNEGKIDFSIPVPKQPCRTFSGHKIPCFYCRPDANGNPHLIVQNHVSRHFYDCHNFEDAYHCHKPRCSIYLCTVEERLEHTKLHFEEYLQKLYPCFSYCDGRFDAPYILKKHQKNMHKEQFKCSQCDRKFKTQKKVYWHKQISGHK